MEKLNWTGTEIQVVPKDILSGMRGNCMFCPIALAIRRKVCLFDGNTEVVVQKNYVRIGMAWYSLPQEATDFIQTFDGSSLPDSVSPFSFEIGEIV